MKDPIVYLMKYSKHKKVQMLRLSNNVLQMKFNSGTDALINILDLKKKVVVIENGVETEVSVEEIVEEKGEKIKLFDSEKMAYIRKFLTSILNDSKREN